MPPHLGELTRFPITAQTITADPPRYVYDHIGEDHNNIVKELLATISTFAVTTLWLGPCEIVYIWSVCNCFGLNFELWVQKFFQKAPFASVEVRTWAARFGGLPFGVGSSDCP